MSASGETTMMQCPMTEAPAPAPETAAFDRILVALDASDHANRALEEAVRLAASARGTVTGVHAYAAKLHDVGTGDSAKEKNSHGRGTNFDTPSLRGLWQTAPYFHDGSARTLDEVFSTGTTHNISAGISAEEIQALIAYVQALPLDEAVPSN